ncbi:MAG TPA: ATP-binding protein [Candidatus Paceibacterota bacterium]
MDKLKQKSAHGFSRKVSDLLIEHAPEGIVMLSPDGVVRAVNETFLKMAKRREEDLVGKAMAKLDHPHEHLIQAKDLGLILSGKKAGPTEVHIHDRRGRHVPIEYLAVPVYKNASHKIVEGALIFIRDISKRHKLQLKLENYTEGLKRRVEKRTRDLWRQMAESDAVLGSIGEGIVAVDNKIHVTIVNKQAARMLGIGNGKILGKHADYIPQLCRENGQPLTREERPLEMAVTTGKASATAPGDEPLFQARTDGTRFPVGIITTPVRVGRKIIGAVSVFRDITIGRELDKAKKEFVALASHQLRTPLSISGWYLEKLRASRQFPEGTSESKHLATLYKANRRMTDLVDSLLTTSRIEMGTLVLAPVYTDCIDIIDSAHLERLPEITRKNLKVKKEYESPEAQALVDPQAFSIVWDNLFSNACKYTPEGGLVNIRVSESDSSVEFEIADSGYGIPKGAHKKLFTKFFRADNVVDKDTDGTGLGLYIVKSIVDKSHGKISFESEEGKGTTFHLTLPK